MLTLEYKRWDKFYNVIENAKIACDKSNYIISDHFSQVGKTVTLGQTYFAVKTKVREITGGEYSNLSEDEKDFIKEI